MRKQQGAMAGGYCLCSVSQRHKCLGRADEPTNIGQDLLGARAVLYADGDDFSNASVCCLGCGLILSVPGGRPLSTSLQAVVEIF